MTTIKIPIIGSLKSVGLGSTTITVSRILQTALIIVNLDAVEHEFGPIDAVLQRLAAIQLSQIWTAQAFKAGKWKTEKKGFDYRTFQKTSTHHAFKTLINSKATKVLLNIIAISIAYEKGIYTPYLGKDTSKHKEELSQLILNDNTKLDTEKGPADTKKPVRNESDRIIYLRGLMNKIRGVWLAAPLHKTETILSSGSLKDLSEEKVESQLKELINQYTSTDPNEIIKEAITQINDVVKDIVIDDNDHGQIDRVPIESFLKIKRIHSVGTSLNAVSGTNQVTNDLMAPLPTFSNKGNAKKQNPWDNQTPPPAAPKKKQRKAPSPPKGEKKESTSPPPNEE